MSISFVLKPRDQTRKHAVFLSLQYAILTLGSEFFTCVGMDWDKEQVVIGFVRSLIFLGLFPVGMHMRSSVAKLPDGELSRYLEMTVFKGALVIGLGQLSFLVFSPIQCHSENSLEGGSWIDCQRSLFSQAGLR